MSEEQLTPELLKKEREERQEILDASPTYQKMKALEAEEVRRQTLEFLLQEAPLGHTIFVHYAAPEFDQYISDIPQTLWFYCDSPECARVSRFYYCSPVLVKGNGYLHIPPYTMALMYEFRCGYCHRAKVIPVTITKNAYERGYSLTKAGEWPLPGEPLDGEIIKFAGKDKFFLLKGYELECASYGIGALSYYRRFVQERGTEILTTIRKTAVMLNSSDEVLKQIDHAIQHMGQERRFSEAKDYVPRELFAGDQNPVVVLHNFLSVAVHSMSDAECLLEAELARETLAMFAEKTHVLLKTPTAFAAKLRSVEEARKRAGGKSRGNPDGNPSKVDDSSSN